MAREYVVDGVIVQESGERQYVIDGAVIHETTTVAPPAGSVIPVFVFHYRNQGIM
jgi:hypothetical protein